MKKIECKYCGWSWNENEGGDDKYTCHMCGNDNEEHYLNESQEDKSINQYNKDGEKNGPWVEYYPNGKDIIFKGSYKNGEKDGDWVFYYMNGNIELEGTFKNDLKDGVWAQYYRDGNLIRKELYNNGEYVRRISLKESETPKKKLFVPRRLSGEDSRWFEWNKDQPIVDGVQINQYTHDGLKTGMWEDYWDNGQLKYKFSYKNGILDGLYESYWDSGNLHTKCSYKNGILDGLYESYWDGGDLISKGSYKDGEKEGIWEYYYENGQLYKKGLYNNNKKDGVWELYYYSNGNLMYKVSYKNDKMDGIWEFYDENGNLKEKSLYDNGNMIKELPLNESERNGPWVVYYPNETTIAIKGEHKNGKKSGYWEYYYINSNLESEGSYINDEKDGIWTMYDRNGKVLRKQLYDNGKLVKKIRLKESETPKKKLFIPRRLSGENSRWFEWNKDQPIVDGVQINQYTHDGKKTGIWEEYFTDGQLSMKGSYIDNKKEGIWEEYDEYDGSIQKGPYKNGKKDGKWVFYYMNDNIENEGSFKDDLKDGIWEWYYSNGKLYSKGSFKDDLKDGIWEEYYENGQLWYKGLYKDDERDGIWEFYWGDGKLQKKLLYKDGIIIKRLPLNESETPKKKLFIPRRIDERYTDLLNSMITTDYSIETYLKNRDSYKELTKELDPLIMKLPKEQLIMFVKANPFWINSIDKVKHLLNTLNYKENKDIAENHIGQTFSKGNFYTTPELKYYENKLKTPQRSKVDTYVFVGSDEFVETRNGSYKKKFDIERLMKVSLNDWKDTSDYGNTSMIKMMMLRAQANNKQLYKITANKGLLDDYEGKTGSEIPEYILSAIDQKKERI